MPDLRPATSADEDFLLGVYASTREREMQTLDWSPEEKRSFLQMQFKAQSAEYMARYPDSIQSVILVEGQRAGRVWINRSDQEIRLLDIAVLPQFRNSGVGSKLLADLQTEARLSRLPLRHSVHTDNQDAIRFYQRLGFKIVADYQTHYLMEWKA